VDEAEDNTDVAEGFGTPVPPGSLEPGMLTRTPQEPGRSSHLRLRDSRATGDRVINPPDLHAVVARAAGGETPGDAAVPPSEGNEARREGWLEVGVRHCTEERGELAPRGPAGGKAEPGESNRWRERPWTHRSPARSQRDCNG